MQRVLAILFITACCMATVTFSNVALNPIQKESDQASLYREILDRLATRHYRAQPVNDELSRRYLDNYIDQLDPLKSYFLQADIDEFMQWQNKLDDLAKRGDVEPGFVMFNRLRERAVERLETSIAALDNKDYSFDYDIDESIVLDGDKRQWFGNRAEADEFWRKRNKDAMIRLLLSDKEESKARELLIKRYKNQITQYQQRDPQDVFQLYTNALTSLYDPHTSYFSPRTTENFQINMSLSLEGIGAELRTEDEYTEVVRVISGGPADKQGVLKAADRIVGVGQADQEIVDVVGWRIDDVVALIRGPKDSVVRLQVSPSSGEPVGSNIISIVRDKVKLEDKSAQSQLLDIQQNGQRYKLGVIEIPSFYLDYEAYKARDPDYKSTSKDVAKLLAKLEQQQMDGLIIDLRNNSGGLLSEATALTDLFINYGPVVQIRDAQQRVYRNQRATQSALYNGPLLVLINRLSASASEIFAGAMQDYGRALVVGSQSYGKGTVQDVTGLSSGQLKLTMSKFYRVSGDSTQHRGVIPDIQFPSAYDLDEVGESQQENALPWDRIRSVPHSSDSELHQHLARLKEAHSRRRTQDPDFSHMIARLAFTKNWNQQDAITLNMQKRRARSEQWDSVLLELENKRRRLKDLPPYVDMASWKKQEQPQEDNTAESDPMLQEAGYILSDQIHITSKAAKTSPQLVQTHNKATAF